jgi:two-component system, response regulator PdtaR
MNLTEPMQVLIVEDEVLLATELGYLVEEAGCRDVGHATSSTEALDLAAERHPDLILVDVHLSDGPTGVETARRIADDDDGGVVLFMTANVMRLPSDMAGACGVIGKPYSEASIRRALGFLDYSLRHGEAPGPPPLGLRISDAFADRWGMARMAQAH